MDSRRRWSALVVGAITLAIAAPGEAQADHLVGVSIGGNWTRAEKVPTDDLTRSLELDGFGYGWGEGSRNYYLSGGFELFFGTYQGTTPMTGTVRVGRSKPIDVGGEYGTRLDDWKLGQWFGLPVGALSGYGVARIHTDKLVREARFDPAAEVRNLYGLGVGASFEIRTGSGFLYNGHLDVLFYAGSTQEAELELGGGWIGLELKLLMRAGGATGFMVGVGLGYRFLRS